MKKPRSVCCTCYCWSTAAWHLLSSSFLLSPSLFSSSHFPPPFSSSFPLPSLFLFFSSPLVSFPLSSSRYSSLALSLPPSLASPSLLFSFTPLLPFPFFLPLSLSLAFSLPLLSSCLSLLRLGVKACATTSGFGALLSVGLFSGCLVFGAEVMVQSL